MFGDLSIDGTARSKEETKLVKPIAQLLCFIPDAILDTCQKMFVSAEDLKINDEKNSDSTKYYSIKYSPGIIFSGTVPAFDVNFIHPGEGKISSTIKNDYVSLIQSLDLNNAKKVTESQYTFSSIDFSMSKKKNEAITNMKKNYEYDTTREIDVDLLKGNLKSQETGSPNTSLGGVNWDSTTNNLECAWYSKDEKKIYIVVDYYKTEQNTDISGNIANTNLGIVYLYEIDTYGNLQNATSQTGDTIEGVEITKKYDSVAQILQSTIVTFYNALRRIALVGLLSILVYIGIRIVLTSTSAKDKAKYKAMLKDWLIALCILFTLHYIMSITVTVVQNINEVLKTSTMAANGEDIMMTTLRNDIANSKNWSTVIVQVVLYFILTVYTIIFTIQYLRRTIYLAFLTVVAPLITLTYPLDKIKDSKSQAFDMWIKDYIFFTLIQIVHLLIYYILVGSSLDLADEGNWVFAVIAIGFLVPAEKIIKKMFGFEKSKTLGAMAAGATGALVMNAINKISRKKRSKKERQIRKDRKEQCKNGTNRYNKPSNKNIRRSTSRRKSNYKYKCPEICQIYKMEQAQPKAQEMRLSQIY